MRKIRLTLLVVLAVGSTASCTSSGGPRGGVPAAESGVTFIDVFTSGSEGYHTFRIPSVVVTRDGTVLAFCEGRARRADHSQNDIVLKRSADGGKTWGPLTVIAEDGKNALLNPCAVVVRKTGRVLLMYQRYPEGCHTNRTVPGYEGDRVSRSFLITSDNDGRTWSPLLDEPTLIEPQCQGTILRYSDPLDGQVSRILFANPASQKRRANGTVRLSLDEGKTWSVSRVLYPGGYAYSCLTVLPDRTIGCLFERDGYKHITFARFTLAWLTGK